MFNKLASSMSPKTVKMIKVSAIVVTAVAGAVVVGVVLYKAGMIGSTAEVAEVVENAVQAA